MAEFTPPTMMQTDPQQTLLGVLRQLYQLQRTPAIPTFQSNPLGALSVSLSGLGAGLRGQPNPVIEPLQQQRMFELQALGKQADIGGKIADIEHQGSQTLLGFLKETRAERKEEQERKEKERTLKATINSKLLTSGNEQQRLYATRELQREGLLDPSKSAESLAADPNLGFGTSDTERLALSIYKEALEKGEPLSPSQVRIEAKRRTEKGLTNDFDRFLYHRYGLTNPMDATPEQVGYALSEMQKLELARRREEQVGKVQEEEKVRRGRSLPKFLQWATSSATVGEAEDKGYYIPDLTNTAAMKPIYDLSKRQEVGQEIAKSIEFITSTLKKTPEAHGASGNIMASVEGLLAQLKNFTRLVPGLQLGPLEEVTSDTFVAKYKKIIEQKGVGTTNRVLMSELLGLVYLGAIAEGLRTGKELSNKQVELLIERLSGTTQSPEAYGDVLRRFGEQIENRIRADVGVTLLQSPGARLSEPSKERVFEIGGKRIIVKEPRQ